MQASLNLHGTLVAFYVDAKSVFVFSFLVSFLNNDIAE